MSLEPYLFEALVAAIWKKRGYNVHLTPKQSDRGVDVVAQKDDVTVLIQVKQQKGNLDASPIREVYSAMPFYEDRFNSEVNRLAVVTTAGRFTRGAKEMAANNEVELFVLSNLTEMLEMYDVTIKDIRKIESSRIQL